MIYGSVYRNNYGICEPEFGVQNEVQNSACKKIIKVQIVHNMPLVFKREDL